MSAGRSPWTWAAGAALLAFAALAATVVLREATALDVALASFVRLGASPAGDVLARTLTAAASGPATLALSLAAAVAALAGGARRTAAVLVAGWAANALAVHLLKALFGRVRPVLAYTVAALPTPSFPSGHAMNAVVVFGLLAAVASRRWPRARVALTALALALALGAGASRVYLGVHYPTDVLGGFAAGAAVLALVSAALRAAEPPGALRPDRRARAR
ncbi:MAG TPA: phosphatase PAP2 family protein [Anaeromyxobacter sp.]